MLTMMMTMTMLMNGNDDETPNLQSLCILHDLSDLKRGEIGSKQIVPLQQHRCYQRQRALVLQQRIVTQDVRGVFLIQTIGEFLALKR